MSQQSNRFRTLDLIGGFTLGWNAGISGREIQILAFIAKRGKRNEPGMAFAWFPRDGQEWWAALLGCQPDALRKTVARLRKKRLLVDLRGSSKDSRYSMKRGYGIPIEVMEECVRWSADRAEMVYATVPDDASNVTSGHTDVTSGHIDVTSGHTGNAVTCTNTEHTRIDTRENETRESYDCGLTPAPPPEGISMRSQVDDWDAPQDDGPDNFAAPREQSVTRTRKPPAQITDLFMECWVRTREIQPNLAYPWSVKQSVYANINHMLQDHTQELVEAMVRVFFRRIELGAVRLTNPDLWRDFYYHRAEMRKLALFQTSTSTSADRDAEDRAHAEQSRRLLDGLRRDQ